MKAFGAALVLLVCWPGFGLAQSSETVVNLPTQKIGADDLVAISVYGSPELTRSVRVSAEGQIRLPMLTRAIPAAGLVPREIESAIAEALRAEKILVDPVVTVTVAEYRSRPISVAGAVKRPLTFQAFGSVTLLEALTRAEGLAPEAGSEILLTRPAAGGTPTTQRIPVKALFAGDNPGLNPRLAGGEEIRVPLARALARRLFAARRWWGVPVIVLGAGNTARALIERLQAHPEMGLRPVACLDAGGATHGECAGVPVAGPLALAPALAKSLHIRHALVALPDISREDLVWRLDDWGDVFRHVILIPDLLGVASLWASARDLGGVLGPELRQNQLVPINRSTKRALDIAGAIVLGIMALPVLAAAALWIKVSSGGSVIYSHEREGEGGRSLQVPKLRTMYVDADALLMRVLSSSPEIRAEWSRYFKLKRDPRILPGAGKFLRRTSLDELPQLWSVLKGEMSLVGPRPFPAYHLEGFGPRFRTLRSRVKPGLTGLWQVSDRADGDLEVQEALDTYYIRNWSLWLDLYILARTVRAVLFPTGAY